LTRIDLHTHSTVSDGTDTPRELMHAAAAAGLDVIALTDHDSTAGWAEAAQTASALGMAVVPGIELTTMLGPSIVHVLGYLFDPQDPALPLAQDDVRHPV
jgi:predicted metal-dependent phosphoesterase TrpH